ncbi:site-specific integrase [Amycolatopsis sp. K13G38]|uniref:Site-specific integrase n=1 Tax=Amycolatopsis acididurans TaxID=2724524 RepID=A0ABX1J0L2_9PSEU|nr:site-specific integrase [Amycolatopsis acididurans]NKQ53310.1 site-specific integrase [Amycolatopsis acididurans]
MGFINKTPAGSWRANWRDPAGKQKAKTFPTKREAQRFLAEIETAKASGSYVSPAAGKTRFRDHAEPWIAARTTEATTTARDISVMRTHVLPKWGDWQLAKITHLAVQQWVTELARHLSRSMVSKCLQLTSNVMRSAVRNRLVTLNPCEDVTLPKIRQRDTDDRIISREELREFLLPVVPDRYRALVAVAAGTGLRWGEVVGLRTDAVNLGDKPAVRVIRTVIEVSGHTSFKPYPKSRAGARTVPLPNWAADLLREHLTRYRPEDGGLIFANEAGQPLRRTLFRSRVWRPALVRAGLLGEVKIYDDERFEAIWTDADGNKQSQHFDKRREAVIHVARHQAGGIRFHDLRHSYGTWLADDGVPPNKLQKVMGHESVTTTLKFYVRKTEDHDAILDVLNDPEDDDPEDDDPEDDEKAS